MIQKSIILAIAISICAGTAAIGQSSTFVLTGQTDISSAGDVSDFVPQDVLDSTQNGLLSFSVSFSVDTIVDPFNGFGTGPLTCIASAPVESCTIFPGGRRAEYSIDNIQVEVGGISTQSSTTTGTVLITDRNGSNSLPDEIRIDVPTFIFPGSDGLGVSVVALVNGANDTYNTGTASALTSFNSMTQKQLATLSFSKPLSPTSGFRTSINPAADNLKLSSTVPEPSTWVMMLAGFAISGIALRRRRTVVNDPI